MFGCVRASYGSIRLPRCSLRDRVDFRLISELGCTSASFPLGIVFFHRCGENPSAKLQRLSSEDCRTQVLVQAVNQNAEMRSPLACSQRRCEESPSSKLQMRVSSEDIRTPVHGQAVKQSAVMRSVLHLFIPFSLSWSRRR